jgi:hypothetical protein
MKKLIITFLLLLAQASFASGNVVCLYRNIDQQWLAIPGFGTIELDNKKELQAYSIGIQEDLGGHALCSRFISDNENSKSIFEQTYYIGSEDSLGPDATSCDYISSKPYETVFRRKVTIASGSYSKIGTNKTKLIHYVPTNLELHNWLSSNDEEMDRLVLNKCLALMPGSIPWPDNILGFKILR